MHVLHIIPSMNPSTGGPPRVLSNMVRGQLSLGYHVTVLSSDETASLQNYLKIFLSDIEISKVRFCQFNFFGLIIKKDLPYSIMHLHGFWNPIFIYSCLFAALNNLPLVIEPDGVLNFYGSFFKKWKKIVLYHGFYQIIMRRASLILAGSSNEYIELSAITGFGENKIKKSNLNAVDHTLIRRLVSKVCLDDNLGLPASFFVFMGRWHPKKGIEALLEAFEILNEKGGDKLISSLVLIGPSKIEIKNYYNKRGQAVPNWVYPLGEIHDLQKWAILSRAYFFILPSYQEGFPVSVIESLAAGTPVVVSRHCNLGLDKTHDSIIVFDEVEANLIYQTILNYCLVQDHQVLRKNALLVVERYYDIKMVIKGLNGLYQSVLEDK